MVYAFKFFNICQNTQIYNKPVLINYDSEDDDNDKNNVKVKKSSFKHSHHYSCITAKKT